jgi:hypothetical protein
VSAQTFAPPLGHIVPVQLHAPALHTSPRVHALVQLPQWAGSTLTFEHWLLHITSPTGHVQTPPTQLSPTGHL